MEGDLSLSQSLGGLRIANPDTLSPTPASVHEAHEEVAEPPLSISSQGTSVAVQEPSQAYHLPQIPQQNIDILQSVNGAFDRSTPVAAEDDQILQQRTRSQHSDEPSHSSPSLRPTYSQRQKYRQSIPLTYQDQQQQGQFSQYTAMVPQGQRPVGSSGRPASAFYTQPISASHSANSLSRSESYRMRTEPSRTSASSMIRRSNSRSAALALQAGVPIRDSSHNDRQYRHSQIPLGNGPVPPRMRLGSQSGPHGVPHGPKDWNDRGAAIGRRKDTGPDAQGEPQVMKKGVQDFSFGRTLGEGSYSTVLAATDRQTLREYAVKVLDKRHIIKEKKVKYVNLEKDALNRLTKHPGVVRLYYTFQDERSLYFVLDLASGGELLGVLKKMGTFDEECTRFYGAQILDTIDYMHSKGVIHRDLKPENVLLDDHMRVKITDFGTAKVLDLPTKADGLTCMDPESQRSNSFVGTAEYVSPELLTDKNAGKESDLWAFGCIIYQLLAGRPPFKAANEYQTFQKIVALDYQFPRGFPDVARDLIERLLILDPAKRLTVEHIKNHEFFKGVNWGSLWTQKAPRLKAYNPATAEGVIRNGTGVSNGNSYPPDIGVSHNTKPIQFPPPGTSNGQPVRPTAPRLITELPPPSQLDIEWSPVLTRNNERILKLGDLTVLATAQTHGSNSKGGDGHETSKKLSRFFGGNATKKRQRLVMATSSGRVIMAAAGGEEKKAKTEISLLETDCAWHSSCDAKGVTTWCIDTRDKHYVFDDTKSNNTPAENASAVQDWVETLNKAKEMALQNSQYSNDDFKDPSSPPSSHSNTLSHDLDHSQDGVRGILQRNHSGAETESIKNRKRFSKRQSKSGLAAVF